MSETAPSLPPHLEGQSSWLSKTTSARFLGHPAVWLVATGFFILGGYLWLQNFSQPFPNERIQTHTKNELIGAQKGNDWNPEIYQIITTVESMPITHEADDVRANAYRSIIEQENLIQPLLARAREYLEREKFVSEDEQNAWASYQNILNIDPSHKIAKSSQNQIIQTLQGNADIALEEKDYTTVEQWLSKLDQIRPNNAFQTDYRIKIAQQIREELAAAEVAQREAEHLQNLKSALDIAHTAMKATPANLYLAYTSFQQALEIEPENTSAQRGLRQIQSQRIALVKLAIAKDDYEAAQLEIDSLHQVKTDQAIITELEVAVQFAITRRQQAKQAEREAVKAALLQVNTPKAIVSPTNDVSLELIPVKGSKFEIVNNASNADSTPVEPAEKLSPAQVTPIEVTRVEIPAPIAVPSPLGDTSKAQLAAGIKAYYAGEYNLAFETLHPLAEENSARAQFRIGIMYYRGRTVVKNDDLARQWISRALPGVIRASENNEAWAQADLGAAYELGIGLNRDIERAASFYKKSASQGYAGAQTNLGVLYGTGDGVDYNRKTAIHWLKRASDQGDTIAQENLEVLNAR